MTQEEILKAFEGRWRIYGCDPSVEGNERVKEYARKFFEAGILLAESQRQTVFPSELPTISLTDKTFDYWWDMYDKKIDRGKCEKKWAKLTDSEKRACIAATPAYVASTPDIQFRRHPMTYLNNKSWENQIVPHNETDKQQQQRDRLTEVANRIAEYTKDAK